MIKREIRTTVSWDLLAHALGDALEQVLGEKLPNEAEVSLVIHRGGQEVVTEHVPISIGRGVPDLLDQVEIEVEYSK